LTKKTLEMIVQQPFEITDTLGKYDLIARVHGGGSTGQAGALRLGIARALLKADPSLRPTLKRAGFLTRDPRMKERKKYGLKKARKARNSPNVNFCFITHEFVYNYKVCLSQAPTVRGLIPFGGFCCVQK
jgi:hypothetical protein